MRLPVTRQRLAVSVAVAIAITLVPSVRLAQATLTESMPVPSALQIPFILKILGYDRQLAEKAGAELTMAVVFDSASRWSVVGKDEALAALAQLDGKTVKSLPFSFVAIDASGAGLRERLLAKPMDVVYLAPGTDGALSELLALAEEQRFTTTTGVPGYVERGVAVGVFLNGAQPGPFINVPASKKEGSQFEAKLLRVARLIE